MGRLLVFLTLLAWSACSAQTLTEVVVHIQAEPAVLAAADALALRVVADPEGASVVLRDDKDLRFVDGGYTVALSPENPESAGRYLIEVSALQAGRVLVTARLESGYDRDQTRHLTLLLEDACLHSGDCTNEADGGAAPSLPTHDAGDTEVIVDAALPDASSAAASDAGAPTTPEASVTCSVPRGTYLFTFSKLSSNCDFSVDTSTITQLYVLDGSAESLLETTDDCLPGTAIPSADGCEVTLRQQCDAPNPFGLSAGVEQFLITLRVNDPGRITGTQSAEIEITQSGAMCRVVMSVLGIPQ